MASLTLKVLAFVIALPVAFVAVMALIGVLTENGWARALGALLLLVVIPAFLADRFIPAHDPTSRPGIVSDVFSLSYVAIALLAALLATGPLVREGDRLFAAQYPTLAKIAYAAGGVSGQAGAPISEGPATPSAATPSAPPVAPADRAAPVAVDSGAPPDKKPDPPGAERTPKELFKELAPSVVSIQVKGGEGPFAGEGGGTGFFVAEGGIVATNQHVIAGATSASVKLHDGTVIEDVELLEENKPLDLALLRVGLKDAKISIARLGDSDAIVVGERVLSIGNPLGLEHTLTDGLVSARRMMEGRPMIQMSAPVSPGNSGGPLFNMKGDVVGVTTAQLGGMFGRAQNLNLAVPINELKPLMRSDHAGRRKFGKGGKTTW